MNSERLSNLDAQNDATRLQEKSGSEKPSKEALDLAEKEVDKENSEIKHEYTEVDFKGLIEKERQERIARWDEYPERGPEWLAKQKEKAASSPDIKYVQGIIERGFKLVPGYITLEVKGAGQVELRHFYEVLNNPDKFSPEAVQQAERFKQLRADVERIFPTIPGSEDVLRILKEDFGEGFYKQNKGLDVLIKLYIALRNLGYSHAEISHPGELIGS